MPGLTDEQIDQMRKHLALLARAVQLNKGSLSIESEPGKGTTVTIYLPSNKIAFSGKGQEMKRKMLVPVLLLVLGPADSASAQVITAIERHNSNNALPQIAQQPLVG